MSHNVIAKFQPRGLVNQLDTLQIQFEINGIALIEQAKMPPVHNSSRLLVPLSVRVLGDLKNSCENLIIRHGQMILEAHRKAALVQPLLQKLFQMNIVYTADRVEVQLCIHEIASPKERLGRLQPAQSDPEFRFFGIEIFSREDSHRLDQSHVIKTAIRNTAVKRVSQQVIDAVGSENVTADNLVKDRFPYGQPTAVIFGPNGQFGYVFFTDLEFAEKGFKVVPENVFLAQVLVAGSLGQEFLFRRMRKGQMPNVMTQRSHSQDSSPVSPLKFVLAWNEFTHGVVMDVLRVGQIVLIGRPTATSRILAPDTSVSKSPSLPNWSVNQWLTDSLADHAISISCNVVLGEPKPSRTQKRNRASPALPTLSGASQQAGAGGVKSEYAFV